VFPPGLGDVIFRATFLAQQSGASAINVDILLAALDAPNIDPSPFLPPRPDVAGSDCYAFFANSDWTPLSSAAAEALAPFAEMETVDPATIRKALLAAEEK
jgi:hypothetical protein